MLPSGLSRFNRLAVENLNRSHNESTYILLDNRQRFSSGLLSLTICST